MNPGLTHCEYTRLMQTARRQANRLRDQAMDDFWQRVGLVLRKLARRDPSGKQQGI